MVKRKQVCIPKTVKQRGTNRGIARQDLIVFDFMPVLIGNEFRTNETLMMQLFRDPPVSGPVMLMNTAYSLLGSRYLDERELTPALECYKFALYEQTAFVSFVSSIQEAALLTPEEISHLNLESELETRLMCEIAKRRKPDVDTELYGLWVEKLRATHKYEHSLNRKEYETRQYFEALLEIGNHEQARYHAEDLGGQNLVKRVKLVKPKEILDVKWLEKYGDDNHPESSMFR